MLTSRLLLVACALAPPIGLNPQTGKFGVIGDTCGVRLVALDPAQSICKRDVLLGVLLFFFPCNVLAIASEALDLECAWSYR